MKHCKKCGAEKPESEFRVARINGKDYVRGECRECERAVTRAAYSKDPEKAAAASRRWCRENRERHNSTKRAWYANNKEKHKSTVLKRTYGISLEEYQKLLRDQNGVCAICKIEVVGNCGRKLSVDHNHQTGAVRGILCGKCNNVLGFVNDSVEILQSAIDYLKK